MFQELQGIYRLTRWKEHLGSSVFITALGLSLAAQATHINLYRAIILLLANLLAFTFAFMINDIEDAEDDARDISKSKRNPISARMLTKRRAYIYTFAVGIVSLFMFASLGMLVFLIGSMTLVLGILYSWRMIRLKAWPVVDIVSHALFLGTLQFLAATMIDAVIPPLLLFVWVGFSLFVISMLGDIHNELRDFEVDRKSGLKNTSQLLSLERFKGWFEMLQALPIVSLVIYFIFTLSIFKLLTVALFCFAILVFYYFTGYRQGKALTHPLYSTPIQVFMGLVLVTQVF